MSDVDGEAVRPLRVLNIDDYTYVTKYIYNSIAKSIFQANFF